MAALHLRGRFAEQGRERVDDRRVGSASAAGDGDDLFDLVAGEQHPVAVEYLAARRRDIDRLDPLARDRFDRQRVLASTPCRYQRRPNRVANRQTMTTRTAVALRRIEFRGEFGSAGGPEGGWPSGHRTRAWTRRRRRLRAPPRRRLGWFRSASRGLGRD